jgi:hypothetical protein
MGNTTEHVGVANASLSGCHPHNKGHMGFPQTNPLQT